jgi:hypothetical protein
VPEIDPGSAVVGLTLLVGGILILADGILHLVDKRMNK